MANQLTLVNKGSHLFKVRLLTGASNDPFTDPSGDGSEWNRLLYKVHVDDPEGTPWVSYTDNDLSISTNGRNEWCQETNGADNTERVTRGNWAGITHLTSYTASYGANSIYGWRPVLELVQ